MGDFLSLATRRRLRDASRSLEVLAGPADVAIGQFLEELASALGAEASALMHYDRTIDGPRVRGGIGRGLRVERWAALANASITAHQGAFTTYDPARVTRADRNRAIRVWNRFGREQTEATAVYVEAYVPLGLGGRDQLRTLVCEGPSAVAWVGVFRATAFEAREASVLSNAIPAIRSRLAVDWTVGPWHAAALDAVMAQIAAATFVLNTNGVVLAANAAAEARLARDRSATVESLRAAIRNPTRPTGWNISSLRERGWPGVILAIEIPPARDATTVARRAATRWALTRRQTEVLCHLAAGLSNRAIAAWLSCAEATVEIHVTAILEKADCESRAELIARVWSAPA